MTTKFNAVINTNSVAFRTMATDSSVTVNLLPALGYHLIGALFVITIIISVLANGCGLLVFMKNKTLRSPTNLFIIALCVCDMLMCSCSAVACAASFSHGWVFGDVVCVLEGFMVYFLGLTSMYLLAAISVDRYIVISKPLMSYKITHRVAATAISVCWGLGFFWAALPLVGWSHYSLEGVGISCSIAWQSKDPVSTSYIIIIFVLCFIFPLCIMAFSYTNVYLTVRNIARSNVWDMTSRVARKNLRLERKLFKTCFLMVCIFVFSWLPYAIVSFMSAFGNSGDITPLMATLPALVAKCSGLWNPVIYIATNAQFRNAFYKLFPCSKMDLVDKDQEDLKSNNSDDNIMTSKRSNETNEKNSKDDLGAIVFTSIIEHAPGHTVVKELSPRVSPANGRFVPEKVELTDLSITNKVDA
ncbi:parapinopsin-like [Haliotis cracherodii]|uniref:parapinopsin-like n=1 Tax=Haliotis cracherodii TaxID=6455 RepID=UPI0039ED0592